MQVEPTAYEGNMAKRNYKNDRYTMDDAKKGVTKKSASKAKVAREAASTVYVKDGKPKKSRKQLRYEEKMAEAKRKEIEERRYNRVAGPGAASSLDSNKDHTESKRWRKYWWVFLIAAAAFAFGAYKTQGTTPFYVFIVLSYASIIAALVVEFWKVRKAREKEEKRSEQKLSAKRIKHEIAEQQQARDEKMLKRFKKDGEVDEDLPFK